MKICLAPMEGVVDYVTRKMFSQIGGFDHMVTEFVRVTTQVLPDHVFLKYAPELLTGGRTESGVPVYVQLLGGNPDLLAANALQAQKLGALGIDLNFGCPAKTVNRHDGGATLLKNPHRVFDCINAVHKALAPMGIPVTAKVRLGFDHKDYVKEISLAASEAKAAHLIVHARTKVEGYKPPAHWEHIAQMKEVSKIPVIANGDIWTTDDYRNCVEVSGCTDVALGRSAMSNPGLALALSKNSYCFDWLSILTHLLPQFILENIKFRSEMYAVAKTKQWCNFLSRNYPEAKELFQKLKLLQSTTDMLRLIEEQKTYLSLNNKTTLSSQSLSLNPKTSATFSNVAI